MSSELLLLVGKDMALAAVAATGFALVCNPPRRALPCIAGLASVAHALRYFLMNYLQIGISTASLLAAFALGLGSVALTRRMRLPAEFFSFPALLPMIPGLYAYKTILGLLRFMSAQSAAELSAELVDVFHNGFTTFFVICALVLGSLMPLFIFHKNSIVMTRWKALRTTVLARRRG